VAVHAVLGTIDLGGATEEVVRAAAEARLREELQGAPPPEAVARVAAWVAGFRASPLGREAAAAPPGALLREVPFLLREEGVLLRGQIDLVLRRADGSLLVADHKAAPRPRDPRGSRRYARQVRLYALALAATPLGAGRPPAGGALVYLDGPAGPEVVPVPPDLRGEARGILARFARAVADPRVPSAGPRRRSRARAGG
jgi:hypothetical protein